MALVAGLISLFVYSVLLLIVYLYYRRITSPLSRKFSTNVLLSGVFSILASLVVIVDAVTGVVPWWFGVALFMVAYALLMVLAINHLRLSVQTLGSPQIHAERMEEEGSSFRIVGGFSVGPAELPKIKPICGMFKTRIYIGRRQDPVGCKRVDRILWLSGVDVLNAVDPSKLHVILESVIRAISENGGGGLVILDGVEYLLLHNDFRSVVKFLTSLKDYVMLSNSAILLVLDEDTLGEREVSVLRREFPELDLNKILSSVEKRALFGVLSREDLSDVREDEKKGSEFNRL